MTISAFSPPDQNVSFDNDEARSRSENTRSSSTTNGEFSFFTGNRNLPSSSHPEATQRPPSVTLRSNGTAGVRPRQSHATQRPPPVTPRSNSTSSVRPRQNRDVPRRPQTTQSRSRNMKGATQSLAKETKLLKHRLDRVLDVFTETVVSVEQSRATKLDSLRAERAQLLARVRVLEIETVHQAAELEDSDELLIEMEERRVLLTKEVTVLKQKCYSLAKDVVILKKSLEAYKQQHQIPNKMDSAEKDKLIIENKKLAFENKSLKQELSAKESIIHELGSKLYQAKMNLMNRDDDKENKRTTIVNTKQNISAGTTSGGNSKSSSEIATPMGKKHTKKSHSVTLRGSHGKKGSPNTGKTRT
ncbi:unnamed protein product [Pseudo-nitzschia multistriata]|uniref:Uncharacterized protein n=1 Tax=Pseudo-nitzschia multistriata TaxID=183589 RepID=A0A448Z6F8_9STRA|nr:unnamed protein product [Pseudo-nitzschia multistriata]